MKLLTIMIAGLALVHFANAEAPMIAPSTQPASGQMLSVGGEVPTPLSLDSKALASMTRQEVQFKDHSGNDVAYSGVPLAEILQRAGAPIGNNQMHGPNAALYVLAEAKDGYRVVYGLAELDPDITDRNVIVADRCDGQPLNDREGPLRIIITGEKKQARWIRQLTSLVVLLPGS